MPATLSSSETASRLGNSARRPTCCSPLFLLITQPASSSKREENEKIVVSAPSAACCLRLTRNCFRRDPRSIFLSFKFVRFPRAVPASCHFDEAESLVPYFPKMWRVIIDWYGRAAPIGASRNLNRMTFGFWLLALDSKRVLQWP